MTKPVQPPGTRVRGARRLAVLAVAALGVPLVLLEVLLHLAPGLVPASYRESFPAHGVELFSPGILSRTPVDGLPVPMVPLPWDGAPPADLKELGIAPEGDTADADRFGRVFIPSDARGLPNRFALDRAATVLVGDSFVVSASYLDPTGLVGGLEDAGAGPVYSLAVAGIGPLREAWLLEHVGLALEPERVLWFFFGGNDLSDAKVVLERQAAGLRVHADLPGYHAPPLLRTLGLARWGLGGGWGLSGGRGPARRSTGTDGRPEPLPALTLRAAAGATPESLWVHPSHLARATLPPAAWEKHVAWPATREALLRARDLTRERGASFAVIYLPSKVEACIASLEPDAALLRRHLVHGILDDLGEREILPSLLRNRRAMGATLESFCDEARIPFFSASEALEALAREGRSGYLATDTHWNPLGVDAVLGPLVAFLRERDLLPR